MLGGNMTEMVELWELNCNYVKKQTEGKRFILICILIFEVRRFDDENCYKRGLL